MSRESAFRELLDAHPHLRNARVLVDARIENARETLSACRSEHLDIVGSGHSRVAR